MNKLYFLAIKKQHRQNRIRIHTI